MRMRAILWLGASGLLVSCATPQAYSGDRRPLSEVSIIQVSQRSVAGGFEEVSIESIDGASEIEDWSNLRTGAELLPGEHRIGVRFVTSTNPAFGLASLAADQLDQDEEAATARTLLIPMEKGASYVVYVRREPFGYLVATFPAARDFPERTRFPEDPPAGAVLCEPTPEDARVLRCTPAPLER